MKVYISGANGFLGSALVRKLIDEEVSVRPIVRRKCGLQNELVIENLNDTSKLLESLGNCDVFVHCAALVHQLKAGNDTHIKLDYKLVNTQLTTDLAKACIQAGVKRFVFISSVKVNGESSERPLTENDIPDPSDPYGLSKWQAENNLLKLSEKYGLIVTIVRLPLVYGPGVGANFLNLMKWLSWSLPLPFRGIKNQRSLIFVGNFADGIKTVIFSKPLKSNIYFLSDGQDLSSHELSSKLALNLQSYAVSIHIPSIILRFLGNILGKKPQMSRLLGSLQIDSSAFRKAFHWNPPHTVEEGLKICAQWFRDIERKRNQARIKRIIDFSLSFILGLILLGPAIIVGVLIKLSSPGPILYWSERIGANNVPFMMPKFRSMHVDAPVVATHLLRNASGHLTPIGSFLRKFSIDEFPQLISVLRGQMSLVGPRPALFNQYDLIDLRTQTGVHLLLPGITGWAQINGRDEINLHDKVKFDREYLENKSNYFDLKIIFLTLYKVLAGKDIAH